MTTTGEKRRAAAVCDNCGTTHVVRLWADGSIHPIGGDGSCRCGDADFRILGDDIGLSTHSSPSNEPQEG